MKEQIPLEFILKVFKEQIDIMSRKENLNPVTALSVTKYFFDKYEVQKLDKEFADNDMLLFQYGSYNFEKQKEFYLDITRQFKIDDGQDEFYQLSYTLFYHLEGFEQIKSHNSWSIAFSDLTSWSEFVSNTEGFKMANESKVSHYKIELNKT